MNTTTINPPPIAGLGALRTGTPSTPFFITGYPRSRTTWLANLVNCGGVTCLHDAIGDFPDVQAFIATVKELSAEGPFGDSDSGLILFAPRIVEAFPAAPWVIVERDKAACRRSHAAFLKQPEAALVKSFDILEQHLENFPKSARCLRVPYEGLSNMGTLCQIWNFIGHPMPFDFERAELLQTFAINPLPDLKKGQHLTSLRARRKLMNTIGQFYKGQV